MSIDTFPYPAPSRTALSMSELTGFVLDLAADQDRWLPHLRLPTDTDRWWARLPGGDQLDVWLLSWQPGHATDLHDHGGSAAAFCTVLGELAELRVEGDGARHWHARRPGDVAWLGPSVIHDVHGAGHGPAVSIHAYSPPLRRMNFYAPTTGSAPVVVRTVVTDQPEGEP